MRKDKDIKLTRTQLYVVYAAVKQHGDKWGAPITTDYTDPILDIICEELSLREQEMERVEKVFLNISKDYEEEFSADGGFDKYE